MNIPKEIIELARKGDWQPFASLQLTSADKIVQTDFQTLTLMHQGTEAARASINLYRVLLSSDFWQALGKAKGWRKEEWHPTRTYPDGSQKTWPGYMPYAHRFYDLILTGQDKPERGFDLDAMAKNGVPTTITTPSPIEEFWKEILK